MEIRKRKKLAPISVRYFSLESCRRHPTYTHRIATNAFQISRSFQDPAHICGCTSSKLYHRIRHLGYSQLHLWHRYGGLLQLVLCD